MNKTLQVFKYVLSDLIAAVLAWALFFSIRKYNEDPEILNHLQTIFEDPNFFKGIFIVPIFWIVIYLATGTYSNIYRKSRLKELGQTFFYSLVGVIILFFALILDDIVINHNFYLRSFITLFVLHFGFTYLFRLVLTSITANKIHKRIIGFNTLIIGSNGNAEKIYNEIVNEYKSSGNIFVGFVNVKNHDKFLMAEYLPHLGHYEVAKSIITSKKIEEVIIAIDPNEHHLIEKIISELEDSKVMIKVIPDMHDILLGTVKMSSIFSAPLIHIYPELIPPWQKTIKRFLDIFVSIIAFIVLSPVYLFTALMVGFSSKGPIFYSHERIGLHGKSFRMHKFRSMYVDAEKNGPQLSRKGDPRITHFGKFMRKVRLDELPQFYNVLKGEMSLVGYRPERQYFIDQISERTPHYRLLLKIKPGITSWGQVKYGYAETVDEMIERLKFDILYLENMSLAVDFKIMIYTVLIVMMGRGK